MPAEPLPDADTEPRLGSTLARPSKTRRKQDSHELQELGVDVVALPDDRLAALPIAENLLDAILEFKRTRTHEGKRRQMQYIGKLMRKSDVAPIRQAVDDMRLGRARDSLALHESERWRAELISSDDAVTRWAAAFPASDLQRLRSLVRGARKDAAATPEKRSARAFRELFQFIRQAQDDG